LTLPFSTFTSMARARSPPAAAHSRYDLPSTTGVPSYKG
jgi:hypothetical protein